MNPFFPRRQLLFIVGGAALLLAFGGLFVSWPLIHSSPPAPPAPETGRPALQPTPGLPWFVEVTAAGGIDFKHFDCTTSDHYIMETMGSGVGWIDYNNDGWPDLFFIQDGPVRPSKTAEAGQLPTCKLYRNNGDGTFTDVTQEVGLDRIGFGMGCAVGDYDNDGFDDLVVTYIGGVVLYHNEPDGKGGRRFVDVTSRAGLHDPHWATSCAWADIDGDGFLDLYVCNYVEVDFDHYPDCTDPRTKIRSHCSPVAFANVAHQLYHNNGNGTFTDISKSSGVAGVPFAPGLGVLICDLDGDGRPDIYVANDLKPQYLFHNQGGGKFVEKALLSGCGMGGIGNFIAGMGIDSGDIDGSGRPSLSLTNFQNNPHILFRNHGGLRFTDWSFPSGIGGPSIHTLGFGTLFLDADLDGNLDIAVANGHVDSDALPKFGISQAQTPQLFLGDGTGHFKDVSAEAGEYFRELHVGRGLAYADFDNDGLPDLAFSNNMGPAALLRNRTETKNAWLRLELIGGAEPGRASGEPGRVSAGRSNRNAIGARVEIEAGGKRQVRWIIGGGSYLSASERRMLVGLGASERADRVTVFWPSGRKQEFANLSARRWWRLYEGKDEPEMVAPKPPVTK